MSRIGKLPVPIPDKVEASIEGARVTVKGPNGSLTKEFAPVVDISNGEDGIVVTPNEDTRFSRAMQGTVRSIINGMVTGVTEGFSKNLLINGVGFRAILQGDKIALALGKSHDISHPIPEGVTVTVEEGTKVRVEGADKQAVGQLAAQIKAYYPVEPYKGKGVSIAGEYIRRKEGKKTA